MRQTHVTLKLPVKRCSSHTDPFEKEAQNAVPLELSFLPNLFESIKFNLSLTLAGLIWFLTETKKKKKKKPVSLPKHPVPKHSSDGPFLLCLNQKLELTGMPELTALKFVRLKVEGMVLSRGMLSSGRTRSLLNCRVRPLLESGWEAFSRAEKPLLFTFINISWWNHCNVFIVNGLNVCGQACLTKQHNLH